jgi:hypothetical protein
MSSNDRSSSWWSEPFRMFQTNLREIDADMDVETVLDDIEAHGANAWLVNGGGILSFYPSDLDYQTRNPYLARRPSGDLLGDALAAARSRGIRLLARMDFSKVSERIAGEHPDWLFAAQDGSQQKYNGLVSVCPSAPYYQERAFDVLTELCGRYEVDGFFFNWMSFNEVDYSGRFRGACHCGHCVDAFAKFSPGTPLPLSVDDSSYTEWRRYVNQTLNDLTARFRRHLAGLLPDAALVLGEKADIMFHEANSKVGRDFWAHTTAQAVSVSKSRRPEVPVLVNCAVFVDMPYRYAPVQDEHYKLYFVQAISRGAIPSTYTMGTPQSAPFDNLSAGGEITRFHRDHEETYRGLAQSAPTLLVTPHVARTSSWWLDSSDDEFRGTYEALQRAHLPFDISTTDDLSFALRAERPRAYSVVVLSDLGSLEPDLVAQLDDWVKRGGRLITVGSAGISDTSVQLESSPAARRTAAHTGLALQNTYIAKASPHLGDGFDRISPVFGAYHFLELRPEASTRGGFLAQVPFGPPELAYGTLPTNYPGVALATYGGGIHAAVPWTLGTTYRHLGTPRTAAILVDLVTEFLAADKVISASLPEQIELTLGQNALGPVVHLTNLSGIQRNSVGAPIPVAGGQLRLEGAAGRAARALVSGTECPARDEGDTLVIDLPEIELFEVIQILDRT